MTSQEAGTREMLPYPAFTTFMNFIDGLRQAPPTQIDSSLMKSMGGTSQGQVRSTLRYFGLTDERGVAQPSLKALILSEGEDREKELLEILMRGYPFILGDTGIDLAAATPGALAEIFRNQGLSGDTVRKASSFFLAAAKEAGVVLSPYLAKTMRVRGKTGTGTGNGNGRKVRMVNRAKSAERGALVSPNTSQTASVAGAYGKTVTLPGIGEITLSVSVNPIELKGAVRNWFYELMDKLDECPVSPMAPAEPGENVPVDRNA